MCLPSTQKVTTLKTFGSVPPNITFITIGSCFEDIERPLGSCVQLFRSITTPHNLSRDSSQVMRPMSYLTAKETIIMRMQTVRIVQGSWKTIRLTDYMQRYDLTVLEIDKTQTTKSEWQRMSSGNILLFFGHEGCKRKKYEVTTSDN